MTRTDVAATARRPLDLPSDGRPIARELIRAAIELAAVVLAVMVILPALLELAAATSR